MKHIYKIFILVLFFFLVSCNLNMNSTQSISVEQKSITLEYEQSYDLVIKFKNIDEANQVLIFEYDKEIIEINDDYRITWKKPGTTEVSIKVKDMEVEPIILTVTCGDYPNITEEIEGPTELVIGQSGTYTLGEFSDVVFYTEDKDLIEINNTSIKALKEGTAVLKTTYKGNDKEITINITKDNVAPTISYTGADKLTLNWNTDYDIYEDLIVDDNIDEDIKERVSLLDNFDFKEYGLHTITYVVTDSSGNTAQVSREVEVVWNYDVTFIGHAGSFYGIMNTEEAILYAAEVLKYQAIEVDLSQTSDGVFVLCHDATFGDYTVANTPWSILKDYEVIKSRNSGYPAQDGSVVGSPYTSKLCTLERYLEICKEYGIKAVIELKSSKGITNSDQSRMPALMSIIEKHDMLDDVIFLASAYNTLIWTRQNGYSDIECQYLVGSCESTEYLNRCITYDLDISINVTYGDYSNSDEWLARYKEAGLKISTYTFTQYVNYNVVQTWINKGVDFVTCDWQRMDKLILPTSSDGNIDKYTVKFYDYEGNVVKETEVYEGKTAAAPFLDEVEGYKFVGWDKDITNVQQDLVVHPIYELNEYKITYIKNAEVVTESSWSSKEEFKEEFYSDFFNWIVSNAENINGLTFSNNKYTLTLHDSTATFESAEDIMEINIYIFEKTFSNLIYKPVTREADGTCVIFEDENYFLNSSLYRLKYQALDQWLYQAINSGYPAYSNTFKPLSSGKIQIFFRMHQWFQGTNIPCFDKLPKKYVVEESSNVELPTTHLSYTINDEFVLPNPTSSLTFKGWYDNAECSGEPITKIEKGTTGDKVYYAGWIIE